MRIAHHLDRSPTGVFQFRQKVPLDLRGSFRLTVIRRSLGTRNPRVAQLRAYALSAHTGICFQRARRLIAVSKPQDKDAPSIDTNDPNNPFYIPAYKVERGP